MVRANPYLNPNLDGVAVLVADVARDHHDLLAPVRAADPLGALVERGQHVVPEALEVGVEPATHLARGRGNWHQPRTWLGVGARGPATHLQHEDGA